MPVISERHPLGHDHAAGKTIAGSPSRQTQHEIAGLGDAVNLGFAAGECADVMDLIGRAADIPRHNAVEDVSPGHSVIPSTGRRQSAHPVIAWRTQP